MKKLMNSADDFVKEMIEGVYLANKEKLEYVPGTRRFLPDHPPALPDDIGVDHLRDGEA